MIKTNEILDAICTEIRSNVPSIRSILLIGGNAIGNYDSEIGDFDIVVVMNTALLPIYYKRLKKSEVALQEKYSINVSINPLPDFNVRSCQTNYFLFKISEYAVVLWGEDVKSKLKTKIFCVTEHAILSYISFLTKELIENSMQSNSSENKKKVLHCERKVLIGCAEVYCLLTLSKSKINPQQIINSLNESGDNLDNFGKDIIQSINEVYSANPDTVDLWFKARSHILRLWLMILRRNPSLSERADFKELTVCYFLNEPLSVIHNFQCIVLGFLYKKKVYISPFLSSKSATARLYTSAILLLASLEKTGINHDYLQTAMRLLEKNAVSGRQLDFNAWLETKDYLLDIWEIIDAHMGF